MCLWLVSEGSRRASGAHYLEQTTPIPNICHGIITDRTVFRLRFSQEIKQRHFYGTPTLSYVNLFNNMRRILRYMRCILHYMRCLSYYTHYFSYYMRYFCHYVWYFCNHMQCFRLYMRCFRRCMWWFCHYMK